MSLDFRGASASAIFRVDRPQRPAGDSHAQSANSSREHADLVEHGGHACLLEGLCADGEPRRAPIGVSGDDAWGPHRAYPW